MRRAARTPVQVSALLQLARPQAGQPDRRREANRMLFEWLCHDDDRREVYRQVNAAHDGHIAFPSQAVWDDDPAPSLAQAPRQGPAEVVLVTRHDLIKKVLEDRSRFSNRPYRALGSGNFMLGLDPGGTPDGHANQRQVGRESLAPEAITEGQQRRLIELAVARGSIASLAQRNFDLAELAENVALRYCALLFGFASKDHALLQESLAKAYRAMNYQMFARHFVVEPGAVPAARVLMAALAQRCDDLLRDYDRLRRYPEPPDNPFAPRPERSRWPEGVEPTSTLDLSGFTPLLKAWSAHPGPLTGEDLAVMVVGLLAGTVANVQAACCIALDHVAADPLRCTERQAALARGDDAVLNEALRANPPAPFLPRLALADDAEVGVKKGQELILCLGGGTMSPQHQYGTPYDPLIFGLPDSGVHGCVGARIVWPLVSAIARHVASLPGLAQTIDPVSGQARRLEKRWGFACETFPLQYRRERRLAQQPLQVVMRVRSPVSDNAMRLRRIIRDGAPRIEQALLEARHVHFAWFQLLNGETELVLQTVYDGDFDAYVLHFALKVGDVFDKLFECIEGAPPLPVADHPEAFVETIRRFNRAPLGGYLFSAYPTFEVPAIQRLPT